MQNSSIADNLIEYCLVAAAFLLGFNAFRVTSFASLGDIFLVVAGLIFAIQIATRQRAEVLSFGRALAASLVFFTISLALNLTNDDDSSIAANFGEYIKIVIGLFLIPYLYACLIKRESFLTKAIAAFVISAAINTIVGLSELLGVEIANALGAYTVDGESYLLTGRVRGLTLHPNFLSLISAVALPLAWGMRGRSNAFKVYRMALILLCAAGVIAGGSRAALLATAIVTAWMLYVSTTIVGKIRFIAHTATAVTLLAIIIPGTIAATYLENIVALKRLIDGLGGASAVTDSDDERLGYLLVASDNINNHPISGVGFEWIQHSHNIYVQIFEASGLLGAIAFLFYILHFFLAYRGSKDLPGYKLAISACGLSVLSYLVSGIAANSLYTRPIVLPFAFLWAASVVAKRQYRIRSPSGQAELAE